jgi:hypothetical protein
MFYNLNNSGSSPDRGKDFSLHSPVQITCATNPTTTIMLILCSFRECKATGVKIAWIFASPPPYVLIAECLIQIMHIPYAL